MDLNGNITSFDTGANLVYVDTGGGKMELFHDRLAKSGKMSLAGFSNDLLSIANGMSLPNGNKFDSKKLHNGQFSLAFDNGMTYNDGVYAGHQAHFIRKDGFYMITYEHLNGKSLTVDLVRSILGGHEYYAHGTLGLVHPKDNATINSLVAGYPYD